MSKKWLRFALLLSIICDIIGTTKTEQRKEFKSRRSPALFLYLLLSVLRFSLFFIHVLSYILCLMLYDKWRVTTDN